MKKFVVGLIAVCAVIGGVCFCIFGLLYPLRYEQEILTAAQKYDVPPELIAAVINAESGFNKNKVSKSNAVGLMQVLPSTASYMSDDHKNLFNAADNIDVGVQYLAYLIKKFQDLDTALFAYNAGEGNVTRWLNAENVTKLTSCPFPETNAYVAKVKKSIPYYRHRF